MNTSSKIFSLGLTLTLGACSVLQTDKVDYKSAAQAPTPGLDVPPDLTQLSRETRYAVPGTPVTASSFQLGQTPNTNTAVLSVGDVRIDRAGTQRWLVVNRPADQLWEPVKDFWKENGFSLTLDQANLGVM